MGAATDHNKEALNKKAGDDSRALTSVPLLGREVTDKEREPPKENPLADVATTAEVIITGILSIDESKERLADSADKSPYFFYSALLSLETDPLPQLMEEE